MILQVCGSDMRMTLIIKTVWYCSLLFESSCGIRKGWIFQARFREENLCMCMCASVYHCIECLCALNRWCFFGSQYFSKIPAHTWVCNSRSDYHHPRRNKITTLFRNGMNKNRKTIFQNESWPWKNLPEKSSVSVCWAVQRNVEIKPCSWRGNQLDIQDPTAEVPWSS